MSVCLCSCLNYAARKLHFPCVVVFIIRGLCDCAIFFLHCLKNHTISGAGVLVKMCVLIISIISEFYQSVITTAAADNSNYTSQQDFGTRKVYCVSNVTFHAESKYAIKIFPSPTVFVQWPF